MVIGLMAMLPAASVLGAVKAKSPHKGIILFGTSYRKNSVGDFLIVGEKSSFREPGSMAWVAHFSTKAGTHHVRLSLWQSSKGKTTEIWHGPQRIDDVKTNEIANRRPAKDLVELGAKAGGTYSMRYTRSGTILASGTFSIRK